MWLLSEYLFTLDQEVELFWGQRLTAASLLFFSNRYLPLLCAAWWTPWWRHLQSFEVSAIHTLVAGLRGSDVHRTFRCTYFRFRAHVPRPKMFTRK